nr:MAG TPA: hypothetical protein [Caudoviricetes sp.]
METYKIKIFWNLQRLVNPILEHIGLPPSGTSRFKGKWGVS